MSLRRTLWLRSIEAARLLPGGRAGTAVRHAIISRAHLAPLQLAIAQGDTVVQVGAVGKGEIWEMARLTGPKGHVIAVEPAPDNVAEIRDRLERDHIGNVTVIPKGAWSAPGTQTLHMHPQFRGSHIVLNSGARHDRVFAPEEYSGSIEIEVDRLDDLLEASGFSRVDFIKITVMGAEMQVLAGMDRLLQATPKLWVKAHALIDGQPANRAISAFVRERGYHTVITRGNQGPDGKERPGDVYATRF